MIKQFRLMTQSPYYDFLIFVISMVMLDSLNPVFSIAFIFVMWAVIPGTLIYFERKLCAEEVIAQSADIDMSPYHYLLKAFDAFAMLAFCLLVYNARIFGFLKITDAFAGSFFCIMVVLLIFRVFAELVVLRHPSYDWILRILVMGLTYFCWVHRDNNFGFILQHLTILMVAFCVWFSCLCFWEWAKRGLLNSVVIRFF